MNFPPLDYDLSPYTGWTRTHWETLLARATYGYVLAAERNGSMARALYPDDYCDRPDSVDALEAFARIAAAWGAWLRNPANPACLHFAGREINIEALLGDALLDGTNASQPHTYWGDIGDMDQRIVETADIAVAIWLSRDRVFARMAERDQTQVMAWLSQVRGKATYNDNWILFPAMVMAVHRRLGFAPPSDDLDARLDRMSGFYRGDGWCVDGAGDEYDLYNAWMFNWHYLLWAQIDGDRRPTYRQRLFRRARSFLASFPCFFGANGAYAAWGRSLVYRCAAVSAFGAGYWLGATPQRPGLLRRLSSGCLRYFFENGMFEPDGHYIRQGYHGHFPPAGEPYIGPGSPWWACHGLFALTLDRDDPFWTEKEIPLPVERGDFDLALPTPGFVLCGRRATGQVFLLNARSGNGTGIAQHHYDAKYGKLAFSTHFPFNVVPAAGSYAPDAMVSLTADGRAFGHRAMTRTGGVMPGCMWCEFDEIVAGMPQRIRVAVLVWRDVQIRTAYLQPTIPVRAFEAPGALGAAGAAVVIRRSDAAAGWEYAEADGRAAAIRRLWGYDGQSASEPFLGYSNLNLAYPYSEQPVVYESAASAAARGVSAASLLRPAPFDPAVELAGLAAVPDEAGCFRISMPDGEAVVALGDDLPVALKVGGVQVAGDGLRCVRLKRDLSEVSGIGLQRVDGVLTLAAPGVVRVACEGHGEAHVTTDTGVTLAEAWLGGAASRALVRGLDEVWIELPDWSPGNVISPERVREWSARTERALVELRLVL